MEKMCGVTTTIRSLKCIRNLQPRLVSEKRHSLSGTRRSLSSSNLVFCVANSSASPSALRSGLDWACGPGSANCSAIQPGQPCYRDDNLVALASYAYNDYYRKMRAIGGTCDFGDTAMITATDPSKFSLPSFLSCCLSAFLAHGTSCLLSSRHSRPWFLQLHWKVSSCYRFMSFKA
ncbi:hypothetical protein BHE74_00055704 [Ensete ventricosum]|nr:hypothetical protein GW17_00057443 [Ensete ventricosum]RWW39006.1 hypothetical protein BHE74_00055704 [Ensete ventricosum]RZS26537.1 hypothetical protein BHM03_00059891 [Ensete ventricosum]